MQEEKVKLLSIIIINYNTFDLTCNCLASIYKYTATPFEIILVDNASTECDAELFRLKFPTIKLIKSNENIGFAKGNNLGIRASNGEYVLLLNSDTELVVDSLSYCIKKLNKYQKPAVLSCKLEFPNGTIQSQCSRFPSIALNLLELFRLHKLMSKKRRGKLFLSSYFDHQHEIKPDWIWGTYFMFEKDILQLLPEKKLDDSFFMYGEDMKWCYDFKLCNIDTLYTSGTSIIHYCGQSSLNQDFKINHIVTNELRFVDQTKGKFYSFFYSLTKAANHYFSFNPKSKLYAKQILRAQFKLVS